MADNDKYDGGDVAAEQQTVESPEQSLQALKEERDSLYDRLLRKHAEFENYKKRVDREKAEFAQFASAELIRELLTALDSFELALQNAAGDQNIIRGFELIYKQIQDTLGRFGLKMIEATGQKFDPHFHQAVSTEPTGEVEENTVIREMRKGYLLNGRLLRPAMVTVSAKKE
ncbi:MAG: nucleotide exchange factor GrpE [Acidobacteria bacterium]|nr:nucleotide exchange factor GrpE [Acidobacteriota bacterium]